MCVKTFTGVFSGGIPEPCAEKPVLGFRGLQVIFWMDIMRDRAFLIFVDRVLTGTLCLSTIIVFLTI